MLIAAELSPLIALWGAGLSTLLAFVKIWEIWRDRFRLDTDYYLTDNPEVGNLIKIRNLSNRPQILSRWEVLACSGRWPLRNFEDIVCADFDMEDLRIEPNSTLELRFADGDHFVSGQKRVYIRLFLAGRRRPLLRLIE